MSKSTESANELKESERNVNKEAFRNIARLTPEAS
jgi:hypothetical protein